MFVIMLVVGMAIVAVMAARELRLFLRKRDTYPLRRLTLRLSMAGMLFFLFASLFVGVRVFHLVEPTGNVTLWMAFWGCITLLTGGVICLAIADFRSLDTDTDENTKQLWREIAETIAAHESHAPKEP